MNNKYSIIIPVYNVYEYLDRCVASVLNQTYEQFEIILVDDGSTDGSALLCDNLSEKDERIIVVHKSNEGVSSARNIGLDLSSGDYITFLDADDYWNDINVLQKVNNISDVDLIYMPNIIVRYPNGKYQIRSNEIEKCDYKAHFSVLDCFSKYLTKGGWACYCGFYSREIVSTIRFDESLKIGEDADWFFSVCEKANSFLIFKDPVYNYCIYRPGSTMNLRNPESLKTVYYLVEKWRKKWEESDNIAIKRIYTVLCNNALNYSKSFYLYSADDRKMLIESLINSNSLYGANNRYSQVCRFLVRYLGFDKTFTCMGFFYKLKIYARKLKAILLVLEDICE